MILSFKHKVNDDLGYRLKIWTQEGKEIIGVFAFDTELKTIESYVVESVQESEEFLCGSRYLMITSALDKDGELVEEQRVLEFLVTLRLDEDYDIFLAATDRFW